EPTLQYFCLRKLVSDLHDLRKLNLVLLGGGRKSRRDLLCGGIEKRSLIRVLPSQRYQLGIELLGCSNKIPQKSINLANLSATRFTDTLELVRSRLFGVDGGIVLVRWSPTKRAPNLLELREELVYLDDCLEPCKIVVVMVFQQAEAVSK